MFVNLHKIVARVRGREVGNYAENRDDEQLHMAATGDGLIANGLPELAEIVRLGDSWVTGLTASATALTAVPTTAAIFGLWNGEPGGGRSYVIDSVMAVKFIIDVTTNDLFTLWGQQVRAPVATPADSALAIRSLCGCYAYGGRARTVTNAIATLANRWDSLDNGGNDQAPAIAGSAWRTVDIPLRGRYIVPPGGAFCMHVSEVTATASTFRLYVRWHEVRAHTLS
jgi:hypothetical protein